MRMLFGLLFALAFAACGGDSSEEDPAPSDEVLALDSVTIGTQSGLSDFTDVAPDAKIVLDF